MHKEAQGCAYQDSGRKRKYRWVDILTNKRSARVVRTLDVPVYLPGYGQHITRCGTRVPQSIYPITLAGNIITIWTLMFILNGVIFPVRGVHTLDLPEYLPGYGLHITRCGTWVP